MSKETAPMTTPCGNPYRQPKPPRRETIAKGNFYIANEKGSYSLKPQRVHLVLCRDYLWVSKILSIPLNTITETGLSKHGGYVQFFDALANAEVRFNFTAVGFLRFKQKKVASFLAMLDEHLKNKPLEDQKTQSPCFPEVIGCERCGAIDARVVTFKTLKFVGIAPIAYAFELKPCRYVLCETHARQQALKDCLRTAAAGYLGFPGFLAAPWYVCTNVWSLRKCGAADARTAALCLLTSVALPLTLIATLIALAYVGLH